MQALMKVLWTCAKLFNHNIAVYAASANMNVLEDKSHAPDVIVMAVV